MLISDFPCDLSISFGEVSKGFVCFPGKTEPPPPPQWSVVMPQSLLHFSILLGILGMYAQALDVFFKLLDSNHGGTCGIQLL